MPNIIMSVEDRDTAYVLIEAPGTSLEGLAGHRTLLEPAAGVTLDEVQQDDSLFWVQHWQPQEKITVHRTWDEVEAIPNIHQGELSPCSIPSGIVCQTRGEYEARINGDHDYEAA